MRSGGTLHRVVLSLSRPKNNNATKKNIVEVVTVRACNQRKGSGLIVTGSPWDTGTDLPCNQGWGNAVVTIHSIMRMQASHQQRWYTERPKTPGHPSLALMETSSDKDCMFSLLKIGL